jgi:hypothetical protein
LREGDKDISASADEEGADFVYRHLKLEIGGKKKSKKKTDFVIRDDTDVPYENAIPLWMLGFKY